MTKHKIIAPKKLIEVALPLDNINKACAREKSIRHGHPSTLHLWWARRPLAAARAVLFAQLVNDPSWKYSEAELKKPAIKGAITKKRNELFKLISELVLWENTTNERVLERARAEIWASWRETCEVNKDHPDAKSLFDPVNLPAFHDPFAGGGTIPLEAQRLGLESHATDLNPVAVLISKAMIEIPPRFAGRAPVGPVLHTVKQTTAKATAHWPGVQGLAEDVRRYGQWVRDEAEKRIGHLYPKIAITQKMAKERPDLEPYAGQELTVIAWLWARTVKSPNPAFAEVEVPLASTFMLSTKADREVWIEPVLKKKSFRFRIRHGSPPQQAINGTKVEERGASFICLMSNTAISGEYIKAEGQAGRLGSRLIAIVAEGKRCRVYLPPTPAMEAVAASAKPTWKPDVAFLPEALGFRVGNYGMTQWSHLFTGRQLVALSTLSDLIQETRNNVRDDVVSSGVGGQALSSSGTGATAYGDAIALYLSFALDRSADRGSTICSWDSSPKMEALRNTFGRQAVPMTWDYAEGNLFSRSSGNWMNNVDFVAKALLALPLSNVVGSATQAEASTQQQSRNTFVSTDPPYYDNIGYADLSDFFYVWLRRTLREVFPQLFATLSVPKVEELVATPARHGGKVEADGFFLTGMTRAMHQLAEQVHPCSPVTIYYAFKQSETGTEGTGSTGWETFLNAVLRAGFAVIGTWPMRTELGNRLRGKASNALASSIVLVCRARHADAGTVSRKEFVRELNRSLPMAIAEMTADPVAAIAPVDLAQACIGPGMALFSKHQAVLEADGSPMSVHNALVHINKAIDDYFSQAEGDLDADTRFCIGWFEQFGFETGEFGHADVLARAKGTSVDGVKETGVISSARGKVRLFKMSELPKAWDPTGDSRVPIWEACHHMCRTLGDSERAAGALLAKMLTKQEAIRLLAYRLYTLCERKKWAEHARAYNELITSWPAIVEASTNTGRAHAQLDLLGS